MIQTSETEIPFDDFASQCDLVEAYFGETVDDVALSAPVSKPQLVAVLARAQVTGRELTPERLADRGEVVYRSRHESMWLLETGFWDDVRDDHHLRLDERRAARAVHRRVLEAVTGEAVSPAGTPSAPAGADTTPGVAGRAADGELAADSADGATGTREPFVLVEAPDRQS